MAVTTDIARTWRAPRAVIRRLLDAGQREDRAIAYLLTACLLVFVAQWPRLRREAYSSDAMPTVMTEEQMTAFLDGWSAFDRLVSYEFLAWLMLWPLILYVLAALSHLVAKLFGGKGSWYGARLALFWSLLATVPLLLLHGLTAGLIGPGPQTQLIGFLWLGAFAVIWVQTLREAEQAP
ncbi:YIP1 family protein [Loktanella agnita]|uniref:YIP1 family protein n=1 Tax=Loktanella agnita TaxID=287097 RepID=UPI003985F6E5